MNKEENKNVSSEIDALKKSMIEISSKIKELEEKENKTKLEGNDEKKVNE